MGDREEFLQIWQQHITRPGSEKLLDWLDGDAAGLKSATITVEGPHAYGFFHRACVHPVPRCL